MDDGSADDENDGDDDDNDDDDPYVVDLDAGVHANLFGVLFLVVNVVCGFLVVVVVGVVVEK